MADTVSSNLGLTKPQIGGSDGSWGGKLNTNMDIIDDFSSKALRSDTDIDELPSAEIRAGKVLGFDADGNPNMVSVGSGSDPSLRSDLAATTGAALVGSSHGGSVQAMIDALTAQSVEMAIAWPTFAPFNCSSVYPTTFNTMAAVRLTDTIFMVRQMITATGYVEQFTFNRLQGYAGVNDGFELIEWVVLTPGGAYSILRQPLDNGYRTNTHFAFRVGKSTDNYTNIEANVNGFGHGNMTTTATPTIKLNGAGSSLTDPAVWVPGIANVITGTSLLMTSQFKCLTPDDTQGLTIDYTQNIDATFGLRETGVCTSLLAGLQWQDSPTSMHATNRSPTFNYFNRLRVSGSTTVYTPIGVNGTEGVPWGRNKALGEYFHFYNANNLTVIPTMRSRCRPINIYPSEAWTPYQQALSTTILVKDDSDFTKFVGYGQTFADATTSPAQTLTLGGQLIFDNIRLTYTSFV